MIASLKSYGQAKKFVEASSETGLVIIDAAKGSSVYKVALATGDTKEEMYSYIQKNGITENIRMFGFVETKQLTLSLSHL